MSDLMGKRIVFIWLLLAFAWVAKEPELHDKRNRD